MNLYINIYDTEVGICFNGYLKKEEEISVVLYKKKKSLYKG